MTLGYITRGASCIREETHLAKASHDLVFSELVHTSQASAQSEPSATANPFTIAMMGFPIFLMSRGNLLRIVAQELPYLLEAHVGKQSPANVSPLP